MKPDQYFPELYNEDCQRVSGRGDGPGMLCSFVFVHIKKNKIKLNNYEEFFSCQYALNLINQGIHCYFRNDEIYWRHKSAPFLDMRMCASHHGGIFIPKDILRYVDIPHEMLAEYLDYFLYQYLPTLDLKSVTADGLVSCLREDEECEEINNLID